MAIKCIQVKDFDESIHTQLSKPSRYGCDACVADSCPTCVKKHIPCSCWDRLFDLGGGNTQIIGIPNKLNISVTCCIKCEDKCCGEGERCLSDSGGKRVCCPEGRQCGNKCCPDGEICKNGTCCSPECCDGCCYCSYAASLDCTNGAICESLGGRLVSDESGGATTCGCIVIKKVTCGSGCSDFIFGYNPPEGPGNCCGGQCSYEPCPSSSST